MPAPRSTTQLARAAWLASAVAMSPGCYAPAPALGLPCSPAGECPDGQACVASVCVAPGTEPPDAGGCGPLDLEAALSARVAASDPTVSAGFGGRLAATERWLAIGVENDDDLGNDAGAVYVFELVAGSYTESAKLVLGAAGEHFGAAVALAGDRLVVGAPGASGDVGAAYAYDFTGAAWSLTDSFAPSGGAAGDAFGGAVAASSVALAIGAPGSGGGEGMLYLYEGGDPLVEAALMPKSATQGFAAALAMSESLLAIGTPGDDDAGDFAGAVTVLRRSGVTWQPAASLTASDAAAGDQFGAAVAIDGQRIVVGAPGNLGRGAAYLVDGDDGFAETAKLSASDGQANDGLGSAVAVLGDLIAVGAPNHDAGGTNAGAGFVFRQVAAEVTELAAVRDPMAAEFDGLGGAVGLTTAGVLVGSPLHDESGTANSGAVLVFGLRCPLVE